MAAVQIKVKRIPSHAAPTIRIHRRFHKRLQRAFANALRAPVTGFRLLRKTATARDVFLTTD